MILIGADRIIAIPTDAIIIFIINNGRLKWIVLLYNLIFRKAKRKANILRRDAIFSLGGVGVVNLIIVIGNKIP